MFNKEFNIRFKAAVRAYLWRGRPATTTGRQVKEKRWALKQQKRQAIRMAKRFVGGRRLTDYQLSIVLAPFKTP